MRTALLGLMCFASGVFLTAVVGLTVVAIALDRKPSEVVRMPVPTPIVPGPVPAPGGDVLRCKRVEITDRAGVSIVLTTDDAGVPIAVVRDGGVARTIDLAKVARLVK